MSVSHHGNKPELIQRFLDQVEGRAKREFPQGRLAGEDDGALVFAVAADPEHEKVIVDFGKRVEWIGMGPREAVELARMLIQKARQVSKQPLVITF